VDEQKLHLGVREKKELKGLESGSRERTVGVSTVYEMDGREVGVRVLLLPSMSFLPVPKPTEPMGTRGRGLMLTTHLQVVSRSRMRGSMHPLPIRLHSVVLS
jgi:hypothetical protein